MSVKSIICVLASLVISCQHQQSPPKRGVAGKPQPADNDVKPTDQSSDPSDNSDPQNQDSNPTNDDPKEPNAELAYAWSSLVTPATSTKVSRLTKDYGSQWYRWIHELTPTSQWHRGDGLATEAHETLHQLAANMRNKTSVKDAYVYWKEDKGFYVVEPKPAYRQIKDHIQPRFREAAKGLYDLYLVEQAKSWDNTLYILDEWNGYIATAMAALEASKANQWDNENSDPFRGLGEFTYFGVAMLETIKLSDPNYYRENKAFKAVLAMQLERSVAILRDSYLSEKWRDSAGPKRLEMLLNDSENAKLRNTLKEFFGVAWYQKYFER